MTVHQAMQLLLVAVMTAAWCGAWYVYLKGQRDKATIMALHERLDRGPEQITGCAHDQGLIDVESVVTGEVVAHICKVCDEQVE